YPAQQQQPTQAAAGYGTGNRPPASYPAAAYPSATPQAAQPTGGYSYTPAAAPATQYPVQQAQYGAYPSPAQPYQQAVYSNPNAQQYRPTATPGAQPYPTAAAPQPYAAGYAQQPYAPTAAAQPYGAAAAQPYAAPVAAGQGYGYPQPQQQAYAQAPQAQSTYGRPPPMSGSNAQPLPPRPQGSQGRRAPPSAPRGPEPPQSAAMPPQMGYGQAATYPPVQSQYPRMDQQSGGRYPSHAIPPPPPRSVNEAQPAPPGLPPPPGMPLPGRDRAAPTPPGVPPPPSPGGYQGSSGRQDGDRRYDRNGRRGGRPGYEDAGVPGRDWRRMEEDGQNKRPRYDGGPPPLSRSHSPPRYGPPARRGGRDYPPYEPRRDHYTAPYGYQNDDRRGPGSYDRRGFRAPRDPMWDPYDRRGYGNRGGPDRYGRGGRGRKDFGRGGGSDGRPYQKREQRPEPAFDGARYFRKGMVEDPWKALEEGTEEEEEVEYNGGQDHEGHQAGREGQEGHDESHDGHDGHDGLNGLAGEQGAHEQDHGMEGVHGDAVTEEERAAMEAYYSGEGPRPASWGGETGADAGTSVDHPFITQAQTADVDYSYGSIAEILSGSFTMPGQEGGEETNGPQGFADSATVEGEGGPVGEGGSSNVDTGAAGDSDWPGGLKRKLHEVDDGENDEGAQHAKELKIEEMNGGVPGQ
ncbi:hypothetical protein HDU93_000751, partial [Gonapodya sp. JEL0774]